MQSTKLNPPKFAIGDWVQVAYPDYSKTEKIGWHTQAYSVTGVRMLMNGSYEYEYSWSGIWMSESHVRHAPKGARIGRSSMTVGGK